MTKDTIPVIITILVGLLIFSFMCMTAANNKPWEGEERLAWKIILAALALLAMSFLPFVD